MTYNSITTFSDSRSSPTRPSIIEVVEQSGVHLRRAGREFAGLCPFHSEKTPSFYLNDEKGKFYCFGCGEHGDVFDFVMKKLGVDFKAARAHLGLAGKPRRLKPQKSPERRAAEVVTAWSRKTSLVLSAKMREIGRRGQMARMALNTEGTDKNFLRMEMESCRRQWIILEVLDEDLSNAQLLVELWTQHESIEGFVNG